MSTSPGLILSQQDQLTTLRERVSELEQRDAAFQADIQRLAGQQCLDQMIAKGAPLSQILEAIALFIEQQTEETFCSITLLQGNLLRRGATPSMPASFQDAMDGLIIGPRCGSCGTAAFTKKQVITNDVATDPLWEGYARWLIDNYGLHACWSTPILGTHGQVLGVFSMYRRAPGMPSPHQRSLIDIATNLASVAIERWHGDNELREAKEQAESASRAKSLLLANMGHELRTPLNAIIGYTELIEDELGVVNPPSWHDDLRNIKAAAQQLATLVTNVLDIARLDTGQIQPQAVEFDAQQLVRRAADKFSPLCERKGNRFTVTCAQSLGTMMSDNAKIERILDILLDNANKFTSNGDVILRAERARDGNRDWLVIVISDSGIGMNEHQLESLSQIFFLGDPTSTRRHGGSGLGLALSYGMCRLLGGTIEVQSAAGHGTTFTVRLPTAIG